MDADEIFSPREDLQTLRRKVPVRHDRQRISRRRLLETFPDALFVFTRHDTLGRPEGAELHLVNVKTGDRRVFRRFKVGPNERYRTTAERLSLIEVAEPGRDAATLRNRHDAAFDVEPVTRKFFDDYCDVFEKVVHDIANRHPRWSKEPYRDERRHRSGGWKPEGIDSAALASVPGPSLTIIAGCGHTSPARAA